MKRVVIIDAEKFEDRLNYIKNSCCNNIRRNLKEISRSYYLYEIERFVEEIEETVAKLLENDNESTDTGT
jgi:negative regulator of genetic competence, sporulation and motility